MDKTGDPCGLGITKQWKRGITPNTHYCIGTKFFKDVSDFKKLLISLIGRLRF